MEFHADKHPHTPTPGDDSWRPQRGRKKDTRKWCKGRVGREHKPVIVRSRWPYGAKMCHPMTEREREFGIYWMFGADQHGWVCYHEVICDVCKKRLKATPDLCPQNRHIDS